MTPLDQAAILFQALEQSPRIRHVPLGMMSAIAGVAMTASATSKPRMKPRSLNWSDPATEV